MSITKKDILDYVDNTEYNTNRHVLSTMLDEFVISDNKQEIELSATVNNIYTPASGKVYNKVTVNVPQPTGKITINDNGTNIDIAQYATADVAVSSGGGGIDPSSLGIVSFEVVGTELVPDQDYFRIIVPAYEYDENNQSYRNVAHVVGQEYPEERFLVPLNTNVPCILVGSLDYYENYNLYVYGTGYVGAYGTPITLTCTPATQYHNYYYFNLPTPANEDDLPYYFTFTLAEEAPEPYVP